MALPERYAKAVPEVVDIWTGAGYFQTQGEVWLARCEGEHDLTDKPTPEELGSIKKALILSKEDIDYLNTPTGHETNRYLRLIQGRLDPQVGNYLHRGMTSFDLLDTALALQIIRSLNIVEGDSNKLADALLSMAARHRDTLQVGRTHGQHAIPQTFGRQVIGWYAEVMRGITRIQEAKKIIPFGKLSGEVGTSVNIPPQLEKIVLAKLGLKPDPAPTQVISRDRHSQVALNMAINAGTLARIATNLRTLSRTEIGEVKEPFDPKKQQGSSSMPQKQNSEITERIKGLTRRTKSAATDVLDCIELWDERDISNSATERFSYQDLFGTLDYATRLLTGVIKDARVYPDKMLTNLNLTKGGIYSARLLNELLQRDTRPRTEVYDHVRELVLKGMEEGRHLLQLAWEDPKIRSLFSTNEIAEFFTPDFYLRNIGVAWERLGLENPAK